MIARAAGASTNPGILGFPPRHSNAAAEIPAAERFEVEAMPHMNDIFRTATRLLGERARAEDIVQEVFLQAWKSFHRFETGTNSVPGFSRSCFTASTITGENGSGFRC